MKLFLVRVACIIIVFFGFTINVFSQAPTSGFEVGAHVSAFVYQGDLAPDIGSYKTPAFGIGVFGSYKFNQSLALRANLAVGNLRGDDTKYNDAAWRQDRALSFTSSVTEVSGLVVWNFDRNSENRRDFKWIPYVFGGFGFSFLDIKPDYSKAKVRLTDIAEDKAQPKPESMLIIPVGGGIKYALSEKLSLNAESTYRLASQTDYLDGVSLAGTPQRYDYYYTISVGVIYDLSSNGGNGRGGGKKKNKGGWGNRKSDCAAYQ